MCFPLFFFREKKRGRQQRSGKKGELLVVLFLGGLWEANEADWPCTAVIFNLEVPALLNGVFLFFGLICLYVFICLYMFLSLLVRCFYFVFMFLVKFSLLFQERGSSF